MKRKLSFVSSALLTLLFVGSTLAQGTELVFPQFADGGGYSAEILLTNPELVAVTGTISFKSTSGADLSVEIGATPQSSLEFSIEPAGAFKVQTDGTGPLKVGYVLVSSSPSGSPLTGTLVYTFEGREVSVPASPTEKSGHVFVERGPNSECGVAFSNSGSSQIALTASLLNQDGSLLGQKEVLLAAGQQTAVFVAQLFADALLQRSVPATYTGSVHVSASGDFGMVGFRQRSDGTLTTLPGSTRVAPLALDTTFVVAGESAVWEVDSVGARKQVISSWVTDLQLLGGKLYTLENKTVNVYSSTYALQSTVTVPSSPIAMTILDDNLLATYDNDEDVVEFFDFGGSLIRTVALPSPTPDSLQMLDGILVGNDLIVSEDGHKRIIKISLPTYEVSVFKDLGALEVGWIGALAYQDGTFYVASSTELFRFTESGPVEKVATLPAGNIRGIAISGGYAYLPINFSNDMYRVHLATGSYSAFSPGIGRTHGIDVYPNGSPSGMSKGSQLD